MGAKGKPCDRCPCSLAGLSGVTRQHQSPGPHQVSPGACGWHHGEVTASSVPSMQQPSSGLKMGARYPQMDPRASACPASSLAFISRAQPRKAWGSPAWPSSEATPGWCVGVRAADRGRVAANPRARGVVRQDVESILFHGENPAYPWLYLLEK